VHRPPRHLSVAVVSDLPDPWPTPEPECWCSDSALEYGLTDAGCPRHDPAKPTSAMLCGHCGKTIYWRRPNTKLRILGGWKHEATGFVGCGYGATSVATPREDDDR